MSSCRRMELQLGKECCLRAWFSILCEHSRLPSLDLIFGWIVRCRTSQSLKLNLQCWMCVCHNHFCCSSRLHRLSHRDSLLLQQCKVYQGSKCCELKCKHMNQHHTLQFYQHRGCNHPNDNRNFFNQRKLLIRSNR